MSAQSTLYIQQWVEELRTVTINLKPELAISFETYANEAIFGRSFIDEDLKRLPQGANILEIGGGLMLLSCQLVREGFSVTALEPIGPGFSEFSQLQKLILAYAETMGIKPNILTYPVEKLDMTDTFDFAFSVNVMEHIDDVALGIEKIHKALKPNASYRFTCPNYAFPYEPHFNIPTLFSKLLTEKIFHNRIFHSTKIEDPSSIWQSLNWITVGKINSVCKNLSGGKVTFCKKLIGKSLERITQDREFAKRRPEWLNKIVYSLIYFRLHRLTTLLPTYILPIIDCTITKRHIL